METLISGAGIYGFASGTKNHGRCIMARFAPDNKFLWRGGILPSLLRIGPSGEHSLISTSYRLL